MKECLKLLVPGSTKVREALSIIESGGAQIVLVVDQAQRLIGTVTDGDVRRGLIAGEKLDSSVDKIMNTSFCFIRQGDGIQRAIEMMRSHKIRQVPVVDSECRVVDVALQDALAASVELPNAVVIMAGGKGTRLRPYTKQCPKPMLLVDDKPMLQILLEQFIARGFRLFYFSVNYLKEQIIDFFGDGTSWGVKIFYLIEDEPLGTAGSLKLLPHSIKDPFVVMNGDVLTKVNFDHLLAFHLENGSKATICVREHVTTIPFGVVQAKGGALVGFEEKPSYCQLVNAGIYVVNPELLSLLGPREFTDMPALLQMAQQAEFNVAVFPIHEYWLDVGRPETLRQAHQEWSEGEC